jgi:hypothetical protein
MKSSVRLLLALCALSTVLFAPPVTYSTTACQVDTCTAVFNMARKDTLVLGGGCIIQISSRSRYACGKYDYAVDSIRPISPGCSGLSQQYLWDTSVVFLLLRNPRGFPTPGMDSCVTYRSFKPACARLFIRGGGYDSVYASCDTTACCVGSHVICRDSVRGVHIESSGFTQVGVCPPADSDCVDICRNGPTPKKPVLFGGESQLSSVSVYPNPATNRLTMEVGVVGVGSITLLISSENGNVVYRGELDQPEDGRLSWGIRTEGWPSGTYFFQMTTPHVRRTGSFVISQ